MAFSYWIHAQHPQSRDWSGDQTRYIDSVLSQEFQLLPPAQFPPFIWSRDYTLSRLNVYNFLFSFFSVYLFSSYLNDLFSSFQANKNFLIWKYSSPIKFEIQKFSCWRKVSAALLILISGKFWYKIDWRFFHPQSFTLSNHLIIPARRFKGALLCCQPNEFLHSTSVFGSPFFGWPKWS